MQYPYSLYSREHTDCLLSEGQPMSLEIVSIEYEECWVCALLAILLNVTVHRFPWGFALTADNSKNVKSSFGGFYIHVCLCNKYNFLLFVKFDQLTRFPIVFCDLFISTSRI